MADLMGRQPMSGSHDPLFGLLSSGLLDPPERPGEQARLGKYRIVRFLGWGGMGAAMLAMDAATGQEVVIKTLKPEFASNQAARRQFAKEGSLAKTLAHPNIIPILDVVDGTASPYLVMPFMSGGSLADRVAVGNRASVSELLAIAIPLADALRYSHSRGVIHRDIKPGNVLLDAGGHPFLADFGLVRTVFNDSVLSERTHHCDGTPAYMSPGVAAGVPEDTRCDIYAFGATLYALLAGSDPYTGASADEILRKVQAGSPFPLRTVRSDVPIQLIRVIEGAMGRELRDRYAEMGDVLNDLRRVDAGGRAIGPRSGNKINRRQSAVLLVAALIMAAATWSATRLISGRDTSGTRSHPVTTPLPVAPLPSVSSGAWTIEPVFPIDHARFLLANMDGTPPTELVSVEGNRLVIRTGGGHILLNKNFTELSDDVELAGVQDIVGDQRDELFIRWSEANDMLAGVVNQVGYVLKTFRTKGRVTRRGVNVISRASLYPVKVFKDHSDGITKLLAIAGNGYGLNPRGIYCFSYDSEKLLWSHCVGPSMTPEYLVYGDINQDGELAVVVGSGAPANGNVAVDGTRDDMAYLFTVSASNGTVLWALPLAGPYMAARPLGLAPSGHGSTELAVWVEGGSYPTGLGRESLVMVSGSGKILRKYDHPIGGRACRLLDLHGSGQTDFVFSDYEGYMNVRSKKDLSQIMRKQVMKATGEWDKVNVMIGGADDLNGDGKQEIVVAAYMQSHKAGKNPGYPDKEQNVDLFGDVVIYALSDDLRPIAWRTIPWYQGNDPCPEVCIRDLDGDGKPDILVTMDKGYVFRFGPKPELLGWQVNSNIHLRTRSAAPHDVTTIVPSPMPPFAPIPTDSGRLVPDVNASNQVAQEEQKEPGPGGEMTVDLGDGVKLTLCWCPAGTFVMGSSIGEENHDDREIEHRVTLSKGFWMGKCEVTQAQWERVMGNNPSHFRTAGSEAPVDQVSWDDCVEFVRILNTRVAGGGFRLPTEAEWEYACRAGTTGPYAGNLDDMGWYTANSDGTTHPVGRKKPNAWNLFDMHGNVWEWCADWHGTYRSESSTDPTGPGSGSERIRRGGGIHFAYGGYCRSALRGWSAPSSQIPDQGLRLARTSP